ncbi:MAG TPA: hypothetical protein VGB55_09005, partial [Tepidisphaeraceae bacterium]
MNDHRFIELLEPRQVLSSATASVVNVGETAGSTPSAATLAVTQRQMYFNAVHGTSNTQVLRITNNGDRRLTFAPGSIGFRGEGRRAFGLVNFPAEGVSLAPGRRFNLEIRFTAPAQGQTIQLARLLINSNDPRRPTTSIPLRGLPTAGTKDNLEPSLQKVLNLFNLPINVGDSTPEEYQLGTPTADSDEVRVQSLVRASNSAPVSIRPLAMFGVSTGPAVRLGTYKPGSPDDGQELWYVPQDTAQSVNPTVFGQTLINPGDKPFALFTQWPGFFETNGTERRVYSEDTLNNTWESNASKLRKMRFYPFVDSNGTAVANSYVVAVEEFTQNYDYQDLLFVITNVRPADVKPTI